jgi:hypothetical protein
MLMRNINLAGVGLIVFSLLAKFTEAGAMAFLAPGVVIARMIFRHRPVTFSSHASGPDEAVFVNLVRKTAENYSAAVWCSIAFWFLVGIVAALVLSRTSSRRTPNTALERTRDK